MEKYKPAPFIWEKNEKLEKNLNLRGNYIIKIISSQSKIIIK